MQKNIFFCCLLACAHSFTSEECIGVENNLILPTTQENDQQPPSDISVENTVSATQEGPTPIAPDEKCNVKEEELHTVTALEDLMREHGILNRLLLIYEAINKQLKFSHYLSSQHIALLAQTVDIMENFIENHHEKLEETYIFPLFLKAHTHEALVATLQEQHDAGRHITQQIRALITKKNIRLRKNKKKLSKLLSSCVMMYRVHESREDTELYPALFALISPAQYKALGELFEQKEVELFGKHGVEKIMEKISSLEKQLSIYDLASFTPTDDI